MLSLTFVILFKVFNEQASILADKLAKQVDQKAFNVCPLITLCTLDILCGKYDLRFVIFGSWRSQETFSGGIDHHSKYDLP